MGQSTGRIRGRMPNKKCEAQNQDQGIHGGSGEPTRLRKLKAAVDGYTVAEKIRQRLSFHRRKGDSQERQCYQKDHKFEENSVSRGNDYYFRIRRRKPKLQNRAKRTGGPKEGKVGGGRYTKKKKRVGNTTCVRTMT